MAIAPNVLLREKYYSRIILEVNPKINWKAIEKERHQVQIKKLLIKEFNAVYGSNKDTDGVVLTPGKVKLNCQRELLALLLLDDSGLLSGMKVYTKKGLIDDLARHFTQDEIFPMEFTPLTKDGA